MAQPKNVQTLARILAEDHMRAIEFLGVVECAEVDGEEFTMSDLRKAHDLALRAKVVIPDD